MGFRDWNERQLAASQRREAEIRARKGGLREDGSSLKQYVDSHKGEIIAQFGSIYVFPDRIIKMPYTGWTVPIDHPMRALTAEEQPIAGVSAGVDSTGDLNSVGSLTRSVVVTGWQKRVDTRQTVLVIDGPTFQWVVTLNGDLSGPAREFAAKVTTAGRCVA